MLQSDILKKELTDLFTPMVRKSDFSIGKKFGKIVTSKSNQATSCMTVGPTGSSKSMSNISIGVNAALEIAKRTKGKWTDYFNLDNIAVVDKEEIFRVMEIEKKHSVKLLDDVGIAWGSRKWQSSMNSVFNDITQTMRTANEVLLITIPDTFLLDKIPRSLVHHFIEMSRQSQTNFDKGVAIGKFFQVVRKSKEGQTWYQYENIMNRSYRRVMFKLAPADIVGPYEALRKSAAEKLKREAIASQRAPVDDGISMSSQVEMLLKKGIEKPMILQKELKKQGYEVPMNTIKSAKQRAKNKKSA